MPTEKPRPTASDPTVGPNPPDDERRRTEAPGTASASPVPDARRAAVEDTASAMTGTYGPDELETLREDWPA